MNEQEKWESIPGYEGRYCVSNMGRVYSMERVMENSRGYIYTIPGRIMKQRKNIWGYWCVGLTKNSKQIVYRVHRLVAAAFLNMPLRTDRSATVNHIDGDKTNNHLTNLEVVSQMQNNHHAIALGLVNHNGESNGRAKLTAKEVIEIRNYIQNQFDGLPKLPHGTIRKLAHQYHVADTTIKSIIDGKSWKNLKD